MLAFYGQYWICSFMEQILTHPHCEPGISVVDAGGIAGVR